MVRWSHRVAALALAVLVAALVSPVGAGGKADHPKLRAALHELREARHALQESKDHWPPGYRDRALASTQDAINSVRTILAVKDVNTFKGVDRSPDYYKQYKDHPHLRAALNDLREARDELRSARADAGNLKERAMDDIDAAIGDIVTLIRHEKR